MTIAKAVVLARGLGTRMRQADASAVLDDAQERAANTGDKTMMPFGAPFLDFVLSGLADAGFDHACLIVGPEQRATRHRYEIENRPTRIQVSFALQAQALGTADAVVAAEPFAGRDPFVIVNGDNYYPLAVLRALRESSGPAVAGFARDALVRQGNFDAARLNRFAILRSNERGDLVDIVEKPDETTVAAAGPGALISMNCWAVDTRIFRACADVAQSARGELELPDAVRVAVAKYGVVFRVLPFSLPVFDLSNRADVQSMARALASIRPRL